MAYQGIGTGTTPNDNTGDSLFTGAVKINSNFSEIYNALGDGSNINLSKSRTITAGSGLSGGGDLSANITLNVGQGDGISVSTDTVSVDSTVIRTSGGQTIAGTLNVNGGSVTSGDALVIQNGGDLRLYNSGNAGSSRLYCDTNGVINVDGNGGFSGGVNAPGGFSNTDAGIRVHSPGGASYATTTATINGAIKIRIPAAALGSNTMSSFRVSVYQYNTGLSQQFLISGYNYSVSGTWINVSAICLTDSGSEFTVRFGSDGTSQCVYIGELASSWSYPQVFVTDFCGGYTGTTQANWATGWNISFETTAFSNVTATRTAVRSWNANNDGSGSGLDADLLDGLQSSSANTGSTIVARDSGGNVFVNDITAYRTGATNTGVIFLNQSQNRYLYYDGTQYNLPGAGLNLGGVLTSSVTTGTAPFTINSTTKVNNLNVDLLDGLSSESFLRSDTTTTWSGSTGGVFRVDLPAGALGSTGTSVNTLQLYQSNVNTDAFLSFHIGGDYAAHFGIDGTTNDLFYGGWSVGNVKYKVWHAGNDGSGSGLDADLLDGLQSASSNTGSTIVARDGSGNFSAGTITATTFSGNLANTLTLNTSGTGLTGSTTFNNSGASTFTVTSNATSTNTGSTIVARDGSGNFSAGTITATTFIGNGITPIGGIIMWTGSVAPTGWALCNGNGGVPINGLPIPDLRDRFIVGAGSGYAVGATGGSPDAIVVSHSHTPGIAPASGGGFTISNPNGPTTGRFALTPSAFTSAPLPDGQGYVSTSTSTEGDSGTNKNLPPYYALAFIMRVA